MSKVKVEIKGIDQPNDKRLALINLDIGDYFSIDGRPEEILLAFSKRWPTGDSHCILKAVNVKTGLETAWDFYGTSDIYITKFNGIVVSVSNPVKYKKNLINSSPLT